MLENITVGDIRKMNPLNLIDIRSIEKYNNGHIMNAINIPVNKLLISPERYLRRGEKYYIYCQKGIQSRKLCLLLTNNGYSVVNIMGGYEAWILNE